MQYVDGADLGDHLAEHDPYPWQWTVAVAAQLLRRADAVHAVADVHRDLKPRNVMVKQDGTVTGSTSASPPSWTATPRA
ncbi:hypothetical protein GCM10023238_31000 [Streptomyces heliomycini]